MNLSKEIKKAIESGKLYFGVRQARKSLRDKTAKLYIVAQDCPDPDFAGTRVDNVSIYHINGKSKELGSLCGFLYSVSIVTVIDPGHSALLQLIEEER